MYKKNPNKKSIWEIILEDLIHVGITVGVPLFINSLISKNQKSQDQDEKSSDEVFDDFKTDHDWGGDE